MSWEVILPDKSPLSVLLELAAPPPASNELKEPRVWVLQCNCHQCVCVCASTHGCQLARFTYLRFQGSPYAQVTIVITMPQVPHLPTSSSVSCAAYICWRLHSLKIQEKNQSDIKGMGWKIQTSSFPALIGTRSPAVSENPQMIYEFPLPFFDEKILLPRNCSSPWILT